MRWTGRRDGGAAVAAVEGAVLWRPSRERMAQSRMAAYMAFLAADGRAFPDYSAMHAWSTEDLPAFWESIWRYFRVPASAPYDQMLAEDAMPGARWLSGARLNYARPILQHPATDAPALVCHSEALGRRVVSWRELEERVGSLSAWLLEAGIVPGDRVAGYLPNGPEAVIAFLASASIGAVWSCCSPDFGPAASLDRLAQIDPKVLVAADGTVYGGVRHDRRDVVSLVAAGLPGLRRVLKVAYLSAWGEGPPLPGAADWREAVSSPRPPRIVDLPADHPLWVLYSSGTTGPPKAIVHGHGGMLLEHLKAAALHMDLGPADRFFWMTTTGWMMWNVVVSSLLVGATAMLYDGNPLYPDAGALWRWAADERVTYLGTSAAHLTSCMRAGLSPRRQVDLSALRTVGSTGSPLAPEAYAWVYREAAPGAWLASLSGGTDVCSGLLGGCPIMPVRAGELQAPMLGVAARALGSDGASLLGEVGELVITRPMPSMPLRFWNDPGGERYRESYFDMFPGVWRHGDWVRMTQSGGAVISGRSDATLNRRGVRLGSGEIYRIVETVPGVADSLVVDVARDGGRQVMPLFVVLDPGVELTDALRKRIVERIRAELSPRHAPDSVVAVAAIPRTLSGKRVEVPVRRILEGEDPSRVANAGALADPEALALFASLAARPDLWDPGADRSGQG